MRRRPCANGWLVDVAPARVLSSSSSRLAPRSGRYHGLAAAAIDEPGPIVRSRLASSRLRKEELRAQTPLTPPPFSWIDHLIRPLQQRRRDRQAEGLRGLEVDDQLELRGLLDREVGGLGAPENLVDVASGTSPHLGNIYSIGHEECSRQVERSSST